MKKKGRCDKLGAFFLIVCIGVVILWFALSPLFSKIGDAASRFGPKKDEDKEDNNGKEEK